MAVTTAATLDGLPKWETTTDALSVGQVLELVVVDRLGCDLGEGPRVETLARGGRARLDDRCLGLGRGVWVGPLGLVRGRRDGGSLGSVAPNPVAV